VAEVLNNAKPMPVKGLYTIDDFPERAELTAMAGRDRALNDRRRAMLYIVPGTLTVFTGHANMGKSTVMDSVISHLKLNIPTLVASFETDVKPILRDGIRAAHARRRLA
jgi:twinkle protein